MKIKTEQNTKQKELDVLGKRIEPYWDEKTKSLKKDAPDSIKKDYKRFLELFDQVTTKY